MDLDDFDETPQPPEAYQSLAEWNAHSEGFYAVDKDNDSAINEWIAVARTFRETERDWSYNRMLLRAALLHDQLGHLQRHLTDLACILCAYDDFERRWAAAAPAHREELVLKALAATCTALPQDTRDHCPEAKLFDLAEDNSGLIRLMNGLCGPTYPRMFPHALYDGFREKADLHLFPTSAEEVRWLDVRLCRSTFLSLLVLEILEAFCAQENGSVSFRDASSEIFARADPEAARSAARLAEYRSSEFVTENTLLHQMHMMCFSCHEADNPRLPTCARCMKIGRVVRYCNRTCQHNNWAAHKVYCGKNLDASSALALFGSPPKADTPFAHNPALLHHTRRLREGVHYCLATPWPVRDDLGITLPPAYRALFEGAFRQALRHGDRGSVETVYLCLKTAGVCELGALRAQLRREFGRAANFEDDDPDATPRAGATPRAAAMALPWDENDGE